MIDLLKNTIRSKSFARKYLLQGELLSNSRLYFGKMEAIIFCYEYAIAFNKPLFAEFSDELIDDLCQNITNNNDVSFAYGLSGIAWSFIYLNKRGFITCNINDVLNDIDDVIMQRDPRRFFNISFNNGFEGVLYYVNTRISYSLDKKICMPFDSTYISDLKLALKFKYSNNSLNNQHDIFLKIVSSNMKYLDFDIGLAGLEFNNV